MMKMVWDTTHAATEASDRCATNQNEILHIGFDDTDSIYGKCTTHLAFKITAYLLKNHAEFLDYPLLVRLNPNVPLKTRGNGAVCLRVRVRDHEKVIQDSKQLIEEGSAIGMGANPAVAFLEGGPVPETLREFGRLAMFDILSKQKAENIAQQNCIRYYTFGKGHGLVGSLAAIGNLLDGDHTFEAIAYRSCENYGTSRRINAPRVIEYDNSTFPHTFNSYDNNHERVLIAPHGPDPVLCGIRGENPDVVVSSLVWLRPDELLDGYMVFRSNQGTNMHLQNELNLSIIRVYTSGYVQCKVVTKPETIRGGHVFFEIEDSANYSCLAAVYEPTGLTKIASQMEIGDIIEIGCGTKGTAGVGRRLLNVEYISILKTMNVYDLSNPLCKYCSKRMKSEGKDKGFECVGCRYKDGKAKKILSLKNRYVLPGLYVPSPKSHRHLTKPIHRYGLVKSLGFRKSKLFTRWFFSSTEKLVAGG
jgi:tRNA(Ile2)-agmatinylcytidine synthase